MASEFREFAMKGRVVDLAVGVIIGAALGKIVDSLVRDLLMPVVGKIFGGLDFSSYFFLLSNPPAGYTGAMTYADLTKAGVPLFAYGNFITVAVNFLRDRNAAQGRDAGPRPAARFARRRRHRNARSATMIGVTATRRRRYEVVERRWAARTVLETHTHPFAVRARVVQGEMWLTVGDDVRHLLPGDSFTLDREVQHAERYGPQSSVAAPPAGSPIRAPVRPGWLAERARAADSRNRARGSPSRSWTNSLHGA